MKKKMSLQASVKIAPRYTAEELKAIDHIVESEKGKAKVVRPGKTLSFKWDIERYFESSTPSSIKCYN